MDTDTAADIDAVDYAVLKCVQLSDDCWKQHVYEWTVKHIDALPMDEPKSVQTIGRRIDQLHDAGLLQSHIISPESVNRDMIIGYTLTASGEQVLDAKRNMFLRDMVVKAGQQLLTADETDTSAVKRKPLVWLMVDAFDIDDVTQEEVLPQIETEELLGLLATHFFLDNAGDTFDTDNEEALATFLKRTPQFRKPFERKTIVTRLREAMEQYAAADGEAVRPPQRAAEARDDG